ncbi:UbiX family flavin prenyltransferase [Xanthobacter oligotrophicus]|nr:UbiX family flavin prenyltransferase [Xanthobacter oligotrophicus]MCG5234333.1 UbiX family flavin prenyltransferase [Xanthobacter oligotrophicus]
MRAMQQHVTPAPRRRMIVGISGATGIIYGLRILEVLRGLDIETHLVMSKPGERTLVYETDLKVRDVRVMADFSYADADIGAAIASGSFRTMGMIVAPCSARSLSAIATGNTDGLLTRAADVCLKERRRVVLMFRETPLHAGHIRAMAQATENGAIVFPPVPAFYDRPSSLDDMVNHTVGRVLDLYDLDAGLFNRWSGGPQAARAADARAEGEA